MAARKTVLALTVALGAIALIGTVTGLSLAGAFDSEDTVPDRGSPTSSPNPTPGSEATASPSPTPVGGSPEEGNGGGTLEPDPDYETAVRNAQFSPSGWRTDFRFHTVPYSEITQAAAARDGEIPALDDPKFVTVQEADDWIGALEPVIALEIDGDALAYPLQILTWHEIVNDVVGGVPVVVTFCPLCNSAIAFDRRVDGTIYDFGVSGNLRNSDLIMHDRQTHTWWQQLTGEGIAGGLAGKTLTFLPASIISWEDFKASNPDGKVLSRDTGFNRRYGSNPYEGYDRVDNPPFLFRGDLDGRLLPKERIVAVTIGDEDAAFPFSILEEEQVVNYSLSGQDLVVFFKPGTASALDQASIKDSRDVGATGVFDPELEGQKLTFRAKGDDIVDEGTGSVWNILGEAVEGPLTGKALTPIVHANHFWFSWAAFKPDTKIYQGMN